MGGASEDDNAMKWFLQRANGGDVLVLRASGSNGYNNYLYSDLGVPVNSVETIVCHDATASSNAYVLQKIQQAEAIWFAGGDQWRYISYWRNTPFNEALNEAIRDRKIVIGGTSAGMAIQGKYYFSAENGTVTSSVALNNPFSSLVRVDNAAFIQNNFLQDVITDTHFDNPNRKGRLVAFLARIRHDYGTFAKAIACDEYTAVCIDESGMAKVFGSSPNSDNNAYFVQVSCPQNDPLPETITSGQALTWDWGGRALKVYQIKGDAAGSKSFDLNTWESGTGGAWYMWSARNGVFAEQSTNNVDCLPLSIEERANRIHIFPNPTSDSVELSIQNTLLSEYRILLYNQLGQLLAVPLVRQQNTAQIDISRLEKGVYYLTVQNDKGAFLRKKIVKN